MKNIFTLRRLIITVSLALGFVSGVVAFTGPGVGCTPASCDDGPMAELVPSNIRSGARIAGVTGTAPSTYKRIFTEGWHLIGTENAIDVTTMTTTCDDYKIWKFDGAWKYIDLTGGTYTSTVASDRTIPARAGFWFQPRNGTCSISFPMIEESLATGTPWVSGWNLVNLGSVFDEYSIYNGCPSGQIVKKIQVYSSGASGGGGASDSDPLWADLVAGGIFSHSLYHGAWILCGT